LPFTVATPGSLLDQATGRPDSTLPSAPFVAALSCWVPPTFRPTEEGLTSTVATGTADTVTSAPALCPSLVPVIVATPRATARTSPPPSTDAIPGLLVVQVTARPVRTLPSGPFVTALNWTVAPTFRLAEVGLNSIVATGKADTFTT